MTSPPSRHIFGRDEHRDRDHVHDRPESAGSDRQATYQDVLDAPPNMVAQIIDGDLHLMPRPYWLHVKANGRLYSALERRFSRDGEGPGEWEILSEPEIHLGEDVLVTDIAGWRAENFFPRPGIPWLDCAPDCVCEVLSPSTREHDLGSKSEIYAREGVSHLWFVDPEERTLLAYALSEKKWLPIASVSGEAIVSVPPFETLNIPLSRLWKGGSLLPPSGGGLAGAG